MIQYLKDNKILLSIIGVLVLVIFALSMFGAKMRNNGKIMDANLKAATTEMQELRTKNGDLLVEKQSYVGTIKELEEVIGISKEEIKDLQRKLDADVLYISELEAQVSVKPTEVHDTTVIYRDSSFMYAFHFGDEWYDLKGHSQVNALGAKTWIDGLTMNVPLKVGLTENWEIFATTPNPYITFSDVQGAVLDKETYLKQQKVRRWGLSVSAGMYCGYDFIGKGFYTGPGVGLGISYVIF